MKFTMTLITALFLSSCGGGNSPATSTTISGIASKGPLSNGQITVYGIANGAKDKILGSTQTDSLGNYSLNIGSYSGPVLIEASGGTYKDEATGVVMPLGSTLRSALPNASGTALASVTPISEAAVQNSLADTGGLTASNIKTENDNIKAQVGFDPVATKPVDATDPSSATASNDAKAYAAYLGTVSQYIKNNQGKTPASAAVDFAASFKSSTLASNAAIKQAGDDFGANANNKTGLPSMAALQNLSTSLNANTTSQMEKIDLWKSSTHLRGINVHQARVTDVDGGISGPGPVGPPLSQDDFNQMALQGANLVVLSHAGIFTEKTPYQVDQKVFDNLDALIAKARAADMFVVISMRTGPGRSEFTFHLGEDNVSSPTGWFPPSYYNEDVWKLEAAKAGWVNMWQAIAQRYANNPAVVGYDIMAEPNANHSAVNPGIDLPQDFYPAKAGSPLDWNVFYPRIVSAIRGVDTKTPILVQPMNWGNQNWLSYLAKSMDTRLVYTIHPYDPFDYSHELVLTSYPGGTLNGSTLNKSTLVSGLQPAIDLTNSGALVSAIEFGAHRTASGVDQYIRDKISLFEFFGWNHAIWNWTGAYALANRAPVISTETQFDFRFGSDIKNNIPVNNAFQSAVTASWKKNVQRPSNTLFK